MLKLTGCPAPLNVNNVWIISHYEGSSCLFLSRNSKPPSSSLWKRPHSPVRWGHPGLKRWCSWWRAGCLPCCASPWCPWGASCWCWAGSGTPACRPCGSSPTGKRRWRGWRTSCCMPSSGRRSGARRRPGWAGRSRTRPTGGPRGEAARRGRTPPPPPGLSEPSGGHKEVHSTWLHLSSIAFSEYWFWALYRSQNHL